MSRTLTLWNKFIPGQPGQKTNVGASWLINPNGAIPNADESIPDPATGGLLNMHYDVHPNCLVIHWFFPNIHVGHILWISEAPEHLTQAQIKTVRRIEKQLADDWERSVRWDFITMLTPPHFNSHWDLEKYTRSTNLPTVRRGRDQDLALEQASPETIDHYARLLESRQHEFTDLDIDLVISRQTGLAFYTGNNGLRTYPLDKLGYHNICRALTRVRAYRREQNARQSVGQDK